MTALLEALRRLETHRPSRAAEAAPAPSPAPVATSSPADEERPISLPLPPRMKPVEAVYGEIPLSARATVSSDAAAAAAAIAHRFRSPALVALVTCGVAESDVRDDAEVVNSVGAALHALGHPTSVFDAEVDLGAVYSLAAVQELRAGRGYHLLHTTVDAALEQTPLLGAADGVVVLVELERTPIHDAEAVVGRLRREAVAVSGILLIV